MFVQVIRGAVTDPGQLRAAIQRWVAELSSGATGWLGTTAGVTEDGTSIAIVRFASEADAQRNSDRPEQDRWWTETSKLFSGDVTFKNSVDVDVNLSGDPNEAGFVQVISETLTDTDRARELMGRDPEQWAGFRPDILGTLTAVHDQGEVTTVAYFTSEAEARQGESTAPPPELVAAMEEMQKLSVGEPEYLDLKDPWLDSPAG